jgi:hypothetical protein
VKEYKNIRLFLSLIGLLFFGFQSCEKADNLPQLVVQVLDEQNRPVAGAYVALFKDNESWQTRENPVQVWRTSTATGYVLFTDLEESEYFIYARHGAMDNSMNEYHVEGKLEMNVRKKVLIHIQ